MKNVPCSIQECANKLHHVERKKLYAYGISFSSIGVKQQNSETYSFRLTTDTPLQVYNTKMVQVQINGNLYKIDATNTTVSYESRVLWRVPVFIYGFTLLELLILWVAGLNPLIAFLMLVVIVVNVGLEINYASNLIRDIPFVLEIILA